MKAVKSTLIGFALSMGVIYGSMSVGEALGRHVFRSEMLSSVEPYFADTGNIWYGSTTWSNARAQYISGLSASGKAGKAVAIVTAGTLLLVFRLMMAARKDAATQKEQTEARKKEARVQAIVSAAEELAKVQDSPSHLVDRAYVVAGLAAKNMG